jgi:hypothetical protein
VFKGIADDAVAAYNKAVVHGITSTADVANTSLHGRPYGRQLAITVYTFEAQAGQIVNVAWINPSNVDAMAARVLDPQGQEIARVDTTSDESISGYFETGPMVLEQTGSYRLEVVVAAQNPHTYTLGVARIEPTTVTALPATLSEALNVLGKKALYILDPDVLTLPPSQFAFMKFTPSAANEVTAKLYYIRPHEDYLNYTQPGVLIADNGGNYPVSDIWGNHYIEVASKTGPVGSYTLELANPEMTPMSLHSNTAGSFAGLRHGQHLLYSFDAEVGQMVNVAILARQNPSIGLLGPNGNVARPFPFIDAGINTALSNAQPEEQSPNYYSEWGITPINQTGSYTVVLSPREPNDGAFILGVPLIKQPETLSLADMPLELSGELTVLGESHFYAFSAQAGENANFRLTTPTDNLTITLAVVRKVGNQLYYSASGNHDFRNKRAVTFTTDSERTVETGVVTFPTTADYAVIVYPGYYGRGWLVAPYQHYGTYEGTYAVMIETP